MIRPLEPPTPGVSSVRFSCAWCERKLHLPFTAGPTLAHVPEPWVKVGPVDCCPDCLEAYIPPRIESPLMATET
jgi:hypothetical protein